MYWILFAVLLALDQGSKWFLHNHLPFQEPVPVIPGVFQLLHIHNRGAAYGILQGQQWFFILLTIVVCIFLVILMFKIPKERRLWHLALAGFLAGTLGNFIDRVRLGYVEDFFDIFIIPIFNLADCFLVISVIGICLLFICDEHKKTKEDKEASGRQGNS